MKRFLLGAATVALMAGPAFAAQTHVNLGVALEPPNLDPTAGAAAAIDEIVYQNVLQGLTRIDRNGEVQPSLATSWDISEDGLVYTPHRLEHEMEVTGPVILTLFASSSAPDTDFTAALVDVHPDGKAIIICEGIVRARFRESIRHPTLIEPGEQ